MFRNWHSLDENGNVFLFFFCETNWLRRHSFTLCTRSEWQFHITSESPLIKRISPNLCNLTHSSIQYLSRTREIPVEPWNWNHLPRSTVSARMMINWIKFPSRKEHIHRTHSGYQLSKERKCNFSIERQKWSRNRTALNGIKSTNEWRLPPKMPACTWLTSDT